MPTIDEPEKILGMEPTLSNLELDKRISTLGIKKANSRVWQLLLLGFLAGVYIGFGGQMSLVALEQGMGRLAAGVAFSLGLILVVIAGAELFTGNVLMVIGALGRQVSLRGLLRNWLIVYIGNFIGAMALVAAVWHSGVLGRAGTLNNLGELAASVATAKIALSFTEAFLRGLLCNILVLLAIIMSTIAKDVVSKIFAIIFPIAAFVACGFEHSIANMYLIPIGLAAKGSSLYGYIASFRNILPVTLGNIVGGLLILVLHPNRIRQIVYLLKGKA